MVTKLIKLLKCQSMLYILHFSARLGLYLPWQDTKTTDKIHFKINRYLINFPEIINIITKIFQDFVRFDSLNTVLKFKLKRGKTPNIVHFLCPFLVLQRPKRILNKLCFMFPGLIKNYTYYYPN